MILHHVRQALRLLVREPAFSVAAILTLALGVGANVAVFAVVEAVLLRPLPYADAGELVILKHRDRRTGITKPFIAMGDYVDLAARQTVVESLVGYGGGPATIFGEGEPLRVSTVSAAPGLFETLRVTPFSGRSLTAEDSRRGAPAVAMLGYEVWQNAFGSNPAIVGRSIRVNTEMRQVVGIAPPGFRFPPSQERTGLIVPMTVPAAAPAARKSGWTFAIARLKPGVTIAQAATHFAAVSAQLEREFPEENQGSEYFPTSLRDTLVGDTRQPLLLMQAAVVVVLLIACANVGNLLLSRALGRRREMAVRAALGAGRRRLAVQLMTESLVLAIAAGGAGVAFAYWGVPALVALVPRAVEVPGLTAVGINGGVLAFALGLTLMTAIVFGSIAALTVRADAAGALGTRGQVGTTRAAGRAASTLVVVEVALAIVLLAGAGLILRSFSRLLSVNPGFETAHVLTLDIALPADRYATPESRRAFYERALPAIAELPAIAHVGTAVVTPLTGNNWTMPFERRDRPVPAGERPPDVGWQLASGGFFRALNIPLRSGRLFDARDAATTSPVIIISEAIAKRYFSNETAVGQRIKLQDADAEIVGVVGDIRRAGLTDEPRADAYLPFEQAPLMTITLFVRTTGDPLAALAPVTSRLRSIESNLVISETSTLARTAEESVSTTRLMLWLLGIFAVVALALAVVGVYGVMAYAVRQRTREIGTRMALGATRRDILWIVMRHGLQIAGTGMVLGVAAALLAAQSLAAILFGVTAADPATLTLAALVLGGATLAACYVPARRAANVDPARTLATD